MLKIILQEKIRSYFKIIRIILFLILTTILASIIVKNISTINLILILEHKYISLTIILLAIILILLKSYQLQKITSAFSQDKPYFHFIKTYCMSSFIELTTFTGKIGSDGFKYMYWKDIPKTEKISIIIIQRSADILGFMLLILTFFKPSLLIPLVIIITIMALYFRYKKPENIIVKNLNVHWKVWIVMLIISISSYVIIATQLSLIFYTLGVQINHTIITSFLFSHGAGAISQLPLGLGAKDLSLIYILKDILSTKTILSGLIWARLCGEFVGIVLGAIFLAFTLKQSSNKSISSP